MNFSNKKICDLKDAKAYFTYMGCSSFHMSREYPDRYAEYEDLNIPKSTEHEWRVESFNSMGKVLDDDETDSSKLWNWHSRMADLCCVLGTNDAIKAIHRATERIVDRLTSREKLIVAETIIGRSAVKYQSGLIFHALKLGQPQIASRFCEIATSLIESCQDSGVETKRCRNAIGTCEQIRTDLGL